MIDVLNLWSEKWLESMWSITWQGGVFIIGVFLITKIFRSLSPTIKHLLWMLVIVKFLIMPFVVVSVTLPSLPTIVHKPIAEPVIETPVLPLEPEIVSELGASLPAEGLLTTTEVARLRATIHWPSMLFCFWLFGVLTLLLGVVYRSLRLKREISTAKVLEDVTVLQVVEEGARELGVKQPFLKVSDKLRSPLACGILNPTLVFPEDIIEKFTPSELKTIIDHELAHIKRLDILTNWFQILAQVFYFFNPLLWYANRQIRLEREQACDDWVLQVGKEDRKAYADALVKVVKLCSGGKGFALGIVGVTEPFTLMARRLKMIMDSGRKISTRVSVKVIIGFILIGLVGVPVCALRNGQEAQKVSEDSLALVEQDSELVRDEVASVLAEVSKAIVEAMPGWEVVQCDKEPTVNVKSHKGYRVLLRKGRKKYINVGQRVLPLHERDQLKFVIKYSHIDLVLFPAKKRLPRDTKSHIRWKDVEQEYHTTAVYLGEGHGFRWFGHTTIFWQDSLRRKLELTDGDDRLQLAADGLGIKDKGTMTANSVIGILRREGEKAIPYIEAAIKKNEDNDPWNSVRVLAFIPGKKSSEILRSLYGSRNERLFHAAAYALIHPYRESAKKEYFDMLHRQIYVNRVAKASVEFGWKDALPVLQDVCAKPSEWLSYRSAFEAKRQLEGRPIPRELKEAAKTLRVSAFGPKPVDPTAVNKAKTTIVNSTDKESATVIAISLALQTAKGGAEPVNQIGREILQQLPAETTMPVLKRLVSNAQKNSERHRISKLLDAL